MISLLDKTILVQQGSFFFFHGSIFLVLFFFFVQFLLLTCFGFSFFFFFFFSLSISSLLSFCHFMLLFLRSFFYFFSHQIIRFFSSLISFGFLQVFFYMKEEYESKFIQTTFSIFSFLFSIKQKKISSLHFSISSTKLKFANIFMFVFFFMKEKQTLNGESLDLPQEPEFGNNLWKTHISEEYVEIDSSLY